MGGDGRFLVRENLVTFTADAFLWSQMVFYSIVVIR
jgi:hypothetical protein